jgi:hypothetical protein
MNVTENDLKARYRTLSYDKLISLYEDSGLTDNARQILKEVMEDRKDEAVVKDEPVNSFNVGADSSSEIISEVCVTDIKMPLSSMVVFMVKWSLASIPALIILSILGFVIITVLGSLSILSF